MTNNEVYVLVFNKRTFDDSDLLQDDIVQVLGVFGTLEELLDKVETEVLDSFDNDDDLCYLEVYKRSLGDLKLYEDDVVILYSHRYNRDLQKNFVVKREVSDADF